MTDHTLHRAAPTLQPWTLLHAVIALVGTGFALIMRDFVPVLVMGGLSFLGLMIRYRGHWTPQGRLGYGNTITAVRLVAVMGWIASAPLLHPVLFIAGCILFLIADGFDGWAARRHNEASAFGAAFDMETDAFFTLMLTIQLVLMERVGEWILIVGALRYVYVLVQGLTRPNIKETPFRFTRVIYIVTISCLFGGFMPYPLLSVPLPILATVLIVISFGHSFWYVFTEPS